MSGFVVERDVGPDRLQKQRWTFLLMEVDGTPTLVLDRWARYTRRSTRHGWVVAASLLVPHGKGSAMWYGRLEDDRRGYDGIEEEAVPLPNDVADEALRAARKTIRVGKWADRRNKEKLRDAW